jgi:hypothetical protein
MSRTARNSKVLRSGAIGFVAGLATLGVVAHASPAHGLIAGALGETTSSVQALASGKHHSRHAQQTQDQWLQPQDQSQQWAQPQDQPQQQYAQPQYQQPQQQYVQPAPSQQPQSQAS